MPKRILIDGDPGVDDALAILFALRHPDLQVEALSAVAGNVSLDHTLRNACYLVEVAGRPDLPVAKGCDRPLVRPLEDAAYAHGDDGLAGLGQAPKAKQPIEQHAADLIIETSRKYPGELTLVAIGPLTNVALAMLKDPGLAGRLKELVIMGGSIWIGGNVNLAGEFNIWCDPEAAQIVFRSGVPLRMVGLDVTHKAPLEGRHLELLEAHREDPQVDLILRLMAGYGSKGRRVHDLLTLAAVVDPTLIGWEPLPVDVVTDGLVRGLTIADQRDWKWSGSTSPDNEVQVAKTVDQERFINLFLQTMGCAQ